MEKSSKYKWLYWLIMHGDGNTYTFKDEEAELFARTILTPGENRTALKSFINSCFELELNRKQVTQLPLEVHVSRGWGSYETERVDDTDVVYNMADWIEESLLSVVYDMKAEAAYNNKHCAGTWREVISEITLQMEDMSTARWNLGVQALVQNDEACQFDSFSSVFYMELHSDAKDEDWPSWGVYMNLPDIKLNDII